MCLNLPEVHLRNPGWGAFGTFSDPLARFEGGALHDGWKGSEVARGVGEGEGEEVIGRKGALPAASPASFKAEF